eukprot:762749-Hanusia_phi.AAC.6
MPVSSGGDDPRELPAFAPSPMELRGGDESEAEQRELALEPWNPHRAWVMEVRVSPLCCSRMLDRYLLGDAKPGRPLDLVLSLIAAYTQRIRRAGRLSCSPFFDSHPDAAATGPTTAMELVPT